MKSINFINDCFMILGVVFENNHTYIIYKYRVKHDCNSLFSNTHYMSLFLHN